MSIPQVLVQSVVGLALVFMVLVILMAIIYLMSAIFKAADNRKKPATAAVAASAVTAAVAAPRGAAALPGRGSCGEVKLYDVPDATAAMLMAIVADEMGAPLNELRFISIKEVEGESK